MHFKLFFLVNAADLAQTAEELTLVDKSQLGTLPNLYKNPKDWVKGRGKEKMKETLIQMIQPQIKGWITETSCLYKEFWNTRFNRETQEQKHRLIPT